MKTVDAVHHLPKGSPFGMASTNTPNPLNLWGGSLAGWRQTNGVVWVPGGFGFGESINSLNSRPDGLAIYRWQTTLYGGFEYFWKKLFLVVYMLQKINYCSYLLFENVLYNINNQLYVL
jgi:hypothetical protein